MTKEEKIQKYKSKYGDDAPIPPDHILDIVIREDIKSIMESIEKQNPGALAELTKKFLGENPGLPDPDDPFWKKID
ncbi:MAG: hypothetical protein LAT67_14400 [Balneolales bacterium]|nr:hypothetical protein [Balneolales bacterium]